MMLESDLGARDSHVIDVVMPTYILGPSEDERFRRKRVCELIADCMKEELEGKEYIEGEVEKYCNRIADAVKAQIQKECHFPRYKIMVQSFIGQQNLQDVRIASRCLWDTENDNHASATYSNQYLWATCIVFGMYAS